MIKKNTTGLGIQVTLTVTATAGHSVLMIELKSEDGSRRLLFPNIYSTADLIVVIDFIEKNFTSIPTAFINGLRKKSFLETSLPTNTPEEWIAGCAEFRQFSSGELWQFIRETGFHELIPHHA
jgi:hypothetical protein